MKKLSLLAISLLMSGPAFAQLAPNASKYFVVQNIATEKMRIYERCTETPDCPHRMVYQTDMVVGTTDEEKKLWTKVGTYKLAKWVKFYEDMAGTYPSWYDPNYPAIPRAGSDNSDWSDDRVMPPGRGGEGTRGAFGWYAATMTPNADGQWLHGTIGWGSDGDKFIQKKRKNIFSSKKPLRSHGCTRVENRAVAFMQSFLLPGTDVFRVYALENLADSSLSRYQGQKNPMRFDFILTAEQTRKDNPHSSSRSAVENRIMNGQLSTSSILEEGSYDASQYPSIQKWQSSRDRSGASSDTYNLGAHVFRGVFIVDEGRFADYNHPIEMPRGGVSGYYTQLPDYAKSTKMELIPNIRSND